MFNSPGAGPERPGKVKVISLTMKPTASPETATQTLQRLCEVGAIHPHRIISPAVRKFMERPGYILLVSRKAGVIGNLKDVPTVLVFRPDEFFPLEV